MKNNRVGDRVMSTFFPRWIEGAPTAEKTSIGVSIWGLQLAKAAGVCTIITSSSDAKLDARVR